MPVRAARGPLVAARPPRPWPRRRAGCSRSSSTAVVLTDPLHDEGLRERARRHPGARVDQAAVLERESPGRSGPRAAPPSGGSGTARPPRPRSVMSICESPRPRPASGPDPRTAHHHGRHGRGVQGGARLGGAPDARTDRRGARLRVRVVRTPQRPDLRARTGAEIAWVTAPLVRTRAVSAEYVPAGTPATDQRRAARRRRWRRSRGSGGRRRGPAPLPRPGRGWGRPRSCPRAWRRRGRGEHDESGERPGPPPVHRPPALPSAAREASAISARIAAIRCPRAGSPRARIWAASSPALRAAADRRPSPPARRRASGRSRAASPARRAVRAARGRRSPAAW